MNYFTETKNFVYSLVNNFSKYDRLSECYTLTVDDLADFDIDKIVGLIMSDNPDWADEAIGPDNNKYDSMNAALIIYMKDSTNKYAKENYLQKWRDGIVSYAKNQIEKLLENALEEFNHERAA